MPECTHCERMNGKEALVGYIGNLGILDCDNCGERFYIEVDPGHNCTNVRMAPKQQYRPRKEVA